MAEFQAPDRPTLLAATGIAAFVAAAALLLFILPAEYGIDPTGFGSAIGITDIAAPDGAGASVHAVQNTPFRNDTVTFTVPPGAGLEYKFHVAQGAALVYSWNATGLLFFDFHGEPDGDTTGYFESYEVDTRAWADGSLSAPFSGTHGWYLRNDANVPVDVILRTAGHYHVVGIR